MTRTARRYTLLVVIGVLLQVILLSLLAGTTRAAPKPACSVTPQSGPPGIFTVNGNGANGTDIEVYWQVRDASGIAWSAEHDVDVPRSGKFSDSASVPAQGSGEVTVYSYHWSFYTTAYCFFGVTS